MKDIHDVIKHAKFGDDRLRGSGVVAGQISAFPVDFAGRPYNTLTLPCERVMQRLTRHVSIIRMTNNNFPELFDSGHSSVNAVQDAGYCQQ